MPLKCLSVTQPWASLIILGVRTIEARFWHTAYRGPLAIHAAKRFPEAARALCGDEPLRSLLRRSGFQSWFELPIGAVLGVVQLVDCVPRATACGLAIDEFTLGNYGAGRWIWRLAAPAALTPPVPMSGRPGIFDLADAAAFYKLSCVARMTAHDYAEQSSASDGERPAATG